MSTLLLICILAVAGWLVVNLASARRRSRSSSGDSVAGFSRALDALDPANDDQRPVPVRPARSAGRHGTPPRRPGRHGTPARRPGQVPRARPVRPRNRKPADAGGARG